MRGTPDRIPVSKPDSSREFNSQSQKTAWANIKPGPMRGGIRL